MDLFSMQNLSLKFNEKCKKQLKAVAEEASEMKENDLFVGCPKY